MSVISYNVITLIHKDSFDILIITLVVFTYHKYFDMKFNTSNVNQIFLSVISYNVITLIHKDSFDILIIKLVAFTYRKYFEMKFLAMYLSADVTVYSFLSILARSVPYKNIWVHVNVCMDEENHTTFLVHY